MRSVGDVLVEEDMKSELRERREFERQRHRGVCLCLSWREMLFGDFLMKESFIEGVRRGKVIERKRIKEMMMVVVVRVSTKRKGVMYRF